MTKAEKYCKYIGIYLSRDEHLNAVNGTSNNDLYHGINF